MDQTPSLEKFTEEFIDEFCFDDAEDNRRLELYHEIYGQSSWSKPRKSIFKDREAGHQRLMNDYFSPNLVYPEQIFRRRFRMGRHVFLHIVDALSNFGSYFQQRIDAVGRKGLSPLQKCTASIRMLAYGVSVDADDYVRIGETTTIVESEYLRKPNSNDVESLLQMGEARGFPAWKGMFMSGHKGVATILLEAVVSSDLWIWHAFFGVARSNTNINVLDRSLVFDEVLQGCALEVNYTINGNNYSMGYYLTDGIYPEWATFVKTISCPQDEKRKLFSKYQESQQKDVERAFGVLQSRYAIVRGPSHF
ncbi:uncharacterized protein LOC141697628 [Apium graveolens]|uniref:uncharacterized protein LOC141697628 n=1 Tax=Apium graveolens TaxID=4045 RepID=UPI003D7A5730